jgi:hypothetical protein
VLAARRRNPPEGLNHAVVDAAVSMTSAASCSLWPPARRCAGRHPAASVITDWFVV